MFAVCTVVVDCVATHGLTVTARRHLFAVSERFLAFPPNLLMINTTHHRLAARVYNLSRENFLREPKINKLAECIRCDTPEGREK